MKRVLVIGCGLIGTSLAMALARHKEEFELTGADVSPNHLRLALVTGAFTEVTPIAQLPDTHFDVVILATPVRAACEILQRALKLGDIVFDVCSVKTSICETAKVSPDWTRFVPTHPMAGTAEEGPATATGTLFENRPWLYVEGWPAISEVLPIILQTGARPIGLKSAEFHDEAMALVSHGIHLISLSAMSTYGRTVNDIGQSIHRLSGPAFQDITRLASSPTAFWVEILMENRISVLHQLNGMMGVLQDFQVALETKDEARLEKLLNEAKQYREEWRGGSEA